MITLKQLAAALLTTALCFVAQSASAVGLPDISNAHFGKQLPGATSFGNMLTGGKPDLWLRLRYEDVSDSIPAGSPLAGTGDADLLHLRVAAGFTTKRFYGFYARAEFEGGFGIGNDNALNLDEDFTFPPGPVGSRVAAGHSIIPDNDFAEINEAFIGWRDPAGGCRNAPARCNGDTTIKLGRQTIIYDNHRWVGNIVWRQNHQSFDAFRIDNTSIDNLSLSYSYIDKVNRLFGHDSVFQDFEMNSGHLINVAYKTPFGKLIGYGYLLDFDDNPRTPFPEGVGAVGTPGIANFDSDTFGLRFVGKHQVNNAFTLLYELEFANQDPSHDAGPTLSDNNYYNIEFGGKFALGGVPVVVKVGREVLEGNGVNAVQTPLATVHAFNGWADKFVGAPGGSATPPGGLEDTSVTIVVSDLASNLIGKSKLVFQYHDYRADTVVGGVDNYGDEWGLMFVKPFNKEILGLIKYAKFNDGGDGFSFDTEKFWLMLQYRMK